MKRAMRSVRYSWIVAFAVSLAACGVGDTGAEPDPEPDPQGPSEQFAVVVHIRGGDETTAVALVDDLGADTEVEWETPAFRRT